ncbi:hypothetical protein [Burkholderia vietnamiensis]|uniref:hypothetical protein n=1 Tax=Burkholderia vietnamiensis TaxID=60552 RepID=UPI001CB4C3C6|nr:hypothetical protein [Burkholderia vietnamiensis]CAG9228939.1 conserved hypothetical protein [Burkholderia vietnamiensis]HDR9086346.1 hypothetical protein [Burkholderia vietnamiensis]
MAIKKAVVLDATGATAEYHVVRQVSIDSLSKTTSAMVMSYVSADAFASGKQPLQGATTIFVQGTPADNEGAWAYVENKLIEAQPATVDPTVNSLPYAVNRYMLADGTITA